MTADLILSFLTLSILEIVLGIDNLIFIALVVQNLPKEYARKARFIGLILALVMRIAMLLTITWIMKLNNPIFTLPLPDPGLNEGETGNLGISIKDLLLLAGGIFLIAKATLEIHHDLGGIEAQKEIAVKDGFRAAILQIVFIDLVFSFDSILTAVGLTQNVGIMIAAIVISMIVMLWASDFISGFLKQNPTFKMLALAFILMIGTVLLAESMHFHVPRGYIYFSFAFSMFVEAMNTLARRKER